MNKYLIGFVQNKKKYFFLVIIYVLNIGLTNAQIGQALKNIFKNGTKSSKTIVIEETEVIAKNILKNTDETLIIHSKELAEGYRLNLNEFINKKKKIIEKGLDVSFEVISEFNSESTPKFDNNNSRNELLFIREIFSNIKYTKLHKIICQKFKVDSLTKNEIISILNGLNYNQNYIKANELYFIYFSFSNSFAKFELEKLKSYYKCDSNALLRINDISKKRNIILKDYTCEKYNTINPIIIILAFVVTLIIIFKIRKKSKYFQI